MRLTVFSDTHGRTAGMLAAARSSSPDVLIHLGDYLRDAAELRSAFPDIPLYAVPGNCDHMSRSFDETLTFMADSVCVFITHGHRYGVKSGTDSLLNAAYFSGAKLVLYGHTHIPECSAAGGMQIVNPGSAGMGARPTYAIADVDENGAVVCRICEIPV